MPEQKNQPKAGIKTTELWVVALAGAITWLAPKLFGVEIDPDTQVVITGALASIYAGGRSLVKALTK